MSATKAQQCENFPSGTTLRGISTKEAFDQVEPGEEVGVGCK